MVELVPQTRTDEQYPLLKVSFEGGAGDGASKHPPPTVVSPGWNVTCSSKRSWLNRWPEIVTACWMTGVLLGISFLVMYVLTMGAIRKHSLVIVKCNNSRPSSKVYLHQVIQRGSYVPFTFYSDYLSYMALQYPSLQFNVHFLTYDSMQSNFYRGYRHAKIFPRSIFTFYSTRDYNFEQSNAVEMRDFQLKHENVNITVIPLSKYMAQTPLRYKWRTIPLSYLTFYARMLSVWRTGGIGIDLTFFNNKFNRHQYVDRRITAILQQHNEGIKPEEYVKALNTIDKEKENEFVAMFYRLVNPMLNEMWSFFNRSFTFASDKDLPADKPLIRTHRNKRDVNEKIMKNDIENSTNDIKPIKLALVNTTQASETNDVYQTSAASINNTKSINTGKMHYENKMRIFSEEGVNNTNQKPDFNMTNKEIESRSDNTSNVAKIVLFYDFSLFPDSLGPLYTFSEPKQSYIDQSIINADYEKSRKQNVGPSNILSIDTDGLFVAASSHLHPFLAHIISAGCQRMPPKLAIQDTLLTQCSGLFKDDFYCNNIFVL